MHHPGHGHGGVGTCRVSPKHCRGDAPGASCVGPVQPWGCWGVSSVTLAWLQGCSGHRVHRPGHGHRGVGTSCASLGHSRGDAQGISRVALRTTAEMSGYLVRCPSAAVGMSGASPASPWHGHGDVGAPRTSSWHGHGDAQGTSRITPARPWRCSGRPVHRPTTAVGMPRHLVHHPSRGCHRSQPGSISSQNPLPVRAPPQLWWHAGAAAAALGCLEPRRSCTAARPRGFPAAARQL